MYCMDSVSELVQTTMVYAGIVLDYVYLLSTCTTLKYMQMNVLVMLTLKPCLHDVDVFDISNI